MQETKRQKYYRKNLEKVREYNKEYQRKLVAKDPEKYYADLSKRVKEWRARNPDKDAAHRKVFAEKRAGRLKSVPCFCGETKSEAHHEDYSKPLDVVWFCKKHHREHDLNRL